MSERRFQVMPWIWTIFLFFVCLQSVRSQSVRAFTADEGLSSTLINNIFCDRRGIIWIATEDGLNRYDGVKLTVYRNRPDDDRSLAHNYVRVLFEDRDGNLFVGTYNGIQLYDPATDSFSPPAKFRDASTVKNYITGIIQRKNGELWVSGNVLARLEITPEGLVFERLDLPVPTALVETMILDRADNVWISKEGEGIFRIGPDGKTASYPVGRDLPFAQVLGEDPKGNVYAGSARNGVYVYDKKQNKFNPLGSGAGQFFPVKTICPVDANTVYIGTDGDGMKIYDNRTGSLRDYLFEDIAFATGKSKVHAFCRDNGGNYWIGIYQKGVLMIPAGRNGFRYWGSKSPSKNIIGNYCVTAIYRDKEGTTYVGTDNDGLYVVDGNGKQKAHYSRSGGACRVPSIIVSVFGDSSGNIWLGSFGEGAAVIEAGTGKCVYLDNLADKKGKVRNVYGFAEDGDGRVWIASMGGGLFSYDLRKRRITSHPDINDWIDCLYYSPRKNKLYIGTYSGMCSVDLGKADIEADYALHESIIYSFHEDADGHIWAGTSSGLLEWDTVADSLRRYTTADGLCNDFVYAVEGGNDGCLWISTSGGMSRFNPSAGEFTNYYAGDGLQGNEFSKNASWRDGDGMLWFGGVNGITLFDPAEITSANRKWHVRVTDFYLYGKPVRKGMKSGGRDIIDRPVFEAGEFRLAHDDNAFTIEFSTEEMNATDRIVYVYSMNGAPWINLPHGTNQVSFSNLSPGTYRFRLKARDGAVESDVKEVVIYIAHPWWNTWWAWTVYIITFLAVIMYIVYQGRLRYKARQERLRLLRAEEANEEKLQFFMNISHEIRTPMTLIISPLRELMKKDGDASRQRQYRTIYRNADRILSLVNQLMDIRKIDKGQMRLKFSEQNVVGLLSDLYETFAGVAGKKNISFTFRHDGIDALPLWIDPANFDKIILNILSNAFKFTPEGGSIELRLETRESTEEKGPLARCAEITVTDSGSGINPSELERIFDRFYQTRDNPGYKGTGIGLHLTRSLVQMHHGVVFAENRQDGESGSRFTVRLPLGKEHLREDETVSGAPALQENIYSVRPWEAAPAEDADAGEGPRPSRRILIVEDDAEIRRYLRQELSSAYQIEESSNGREALEKVFRKEPDLVISDVMMPEMDGLTLCRKIKQNIHLNHIPVILLTARVQSEDNIEGLDTGADAYVTKPFNMDVLRHTVRNLVLSRDILRTIYSGRQQTGEERLEKMEAKSPDDRLMERVMKVVNARMGDPGLTVGEIASEIGLSRVHLHRKLKELTNQTTRDFLRNTRMAQAASLLSEKRHSVSEVAALVGYTNLSTFSSAFRALYGVSPSEYCVRHLASGEKEEKSEM